MRLRQRSTDGKLGAIADRSRELLIIVELASGSLDFEQAIGEEQHDVARGELATERLILRSVEQTESRTRPRSPLSGEATCGGSFSARARCSGFGCPALA